MLMIVVIDIIIYFTIMSYDDLGMRSSALFNRTDIIQMTTSTSRR